MRIVQYLDDMILEREKANDALREELTKYVGWCQMLDQSQVGLSLSFSWWMFDQVCWLEFGRYI